MPAAFCDWNHSRCSFNHSMPAGVQPWAMACVLHPAQTMAQASSFFVILFIIRIMLFFIVWVISFGYCNVWFQAGIPVSYRRIIGTTPPSKSSVLLFVSWNINAPTALYIYSPFSSVRGFRATLSPQ